MIQTFFCISIVISNDFGGIFFASLHFEGYAPATGLTFGFFVFVMYAGFPFTVFSQLTTGPMLDAIAPEGKRSMSSFLFQPIIQMISK